MSFTIRAGEALIALSFDDGQMLNKLTTKSTQPNGSHLVFDVSHHASRVARAQYDNAVEAWVEAGWAQVGRLCRFFDEIGMKGLNYPAPTGQQPDPG